jgi:hypothetical protein
MFFQDRLGVWLALTKGNGLNAANHPRRKRKAANTGK